MSFDDDIPSDADNLLDAIRDLDMTTFGNGLDIQDAASTLDLLNGGVSGMHDGIAIMHDDLAGLLGELVDQASDARRENALLHAAGALQLGGMWSDMNAGFDELAAGQQDIADRISDVDATLANVGGMIDGRLMEVGNKIDTYRESTADAVGRLQGEVAIAGSRITGAIYRGSEVLSAALAQGFAKLNAEEERRMSELRQDLRRAAEMPRENQASELYKIAAASYAIGDYPQAAKDVIEALKLKSNHIPSLILLGKIARRKGKVNFAHSRFTRAVLHALQQRNATGFEVAVKELTDGCLQRKDPEKAVKFLEKAIVIARKIFPEMVGRLTWERFRIVLPVLEERGDDQMIRIKLMRTIKEYPEGWGALKNDKEFNALRERYPYLHFTSAIKKAEEVCENKTHGQEMQWFKEIEVFLKTKVLKIEKMTQEMIDVLDILITQVMLIHESVVKKGGRDLARWTATCQEVFGRVMKTYNELPENRPPEGAIIKKRIIRWADIEPKLAKMSLGEYVATMKNFPSPTIRPFQISHGARSAEQQDPNNRVVTNDFTRVLRTGSYDVESPIRHQEEGNAIYVLVPEPNGEDWNIRREGGRIDINTGIVFIPKSTLVDERTGSRFVLDSEGLPRIDKNFHVKLWDITLGSSAKRGVWNNLSAYARTASEAGKEYDRWVEEGIATLENVLDGDYVEFMQDFKRQYTGADMGKKMRSMMRQFLIAAYDRWLNNFDYYVNGLSDQDTWDNMNAAIEKIQLVYKIGLMKPRRQVTAESYWREYFQNNPSVRPSKVIYYDGSMTEAWSKFWEDASKKSE